MTHEECVAKAVENKLTYLRKAMRETAEALHDRPGTRAGSDSNISDVIACGKKLERMRTEADLLIILSA